MPEITVELLQTYRIEVKNDWTYKTLINELCYYFNCKENEIIINENIYDLNNIIDPYNLDVLVKIK